MRRAVSRNDVILGLVTLVLVGFSLIVALVIPRRNPDFPGRGLRFFTVVSVLLVAAMLASVEVFGEEHEEGEGGEIAAEKADTAPGDTGTTQTVPPATQGETGTTPTEEAVGAAGNPEAGEQVFAAAGCGGCHALQAAGSTGTAGPDLDEHPPSFEEAVEQVANGGGGMPAYKDRLSEKEIQDVAAYVVEASKG